MGKPVPVTNLFEYCNLYVFDFLIFTFDLQRLL